MKEKRRSCIEMRKGNGRPVESQKRFMPFSRIAGKESRRTIE